MNKIIELQPMEINSISGGISTKAIVARRHDVLLIAYGASVFTGYYATAGAVMIGDGVLRANDAIIAVYEGKSYKHSLLYLGYGLVMVAFGTTLAGAASYYNYKKL